MSSFRKEDTDCLAWLCLFSEQLHIWLCYKYNFYFSSHCSGCLLKLSDTITLSSRNFNLVFSWLLGFSSRPKSLKVFVNPNSHKRDAVRIYYDRVAPLFKLADIRTDLIGKMFCRIQFKHFWCWSCFLFQVRHLYVLIIISQEHEVFITSFYVFLLWKYLSLLLLDTYCIMSFRHTIHWYLRKHLTLILYSISSSL